MIRQPRWKYGKLPPPDVAAAAKAKVEVMRTTKSATMTVWIVLFIILSSLEFSV
ncbi:MAG: hypothetical protein BWX71_01777 [Deltaproteobacteria bacterium ADurb.Bin072]|nr:MAG: hypothetical protein BWX71_02733 [Deltaproteobacteria bacterium ADurb.Bin072]OQC24838.1 MAG: hypothetical protein BWX71_01777 [Deltaproteobacteria bacterium ADurb.Bin072]